MRALATAKKVVDTFMEWCCIVLLAVMTCLVTWQVFTRYVLHDPSAVSETLAQYLFVWMVMFGSSYVFGLREHLSITVLKDKFPPLANMITEFLIDLVLIAFAVAVCLMGGLQSSKIQMGTTDAALHIPMGIIYSAIPICGAAMLFYALYNMVQAVDEYKKADPRANDGTAGTM